MLKINNAKKPCYVNKEDLDDEIRLAKPTDYILYARGRKSRGYCPKGIMKAATCTEIILDLAYLEHIREVVKKQIIAARPSYLKGYITIEDVIKDIFKPDKDHKYIIAATTVRHIIATVDPEDGQHPGYEGEQYSGYTSPTYSLPVYNLNDFKQIPLNEKEQEAIRAEEERLHNEQFNDTFLKDIITTRIKENCGIDIQFHGPSYEYKQRKYARIIDKADWAKFIRNAIHYYLNGIVKDDNIEIKMPDTKKMDYYCPIFFLDDVSMKKEGEPDGKRGTSKGL